MEKMLEHHSRLKGYTGIYHLYHVMITSFNQSWISFSHIGGMSSPAVIGNYNFSNMIG
jgi:hypothetical protein